MSAPISWPPRTTDEADTVDPELPRTAPPRPTTIDGLCAPATCNTILDLDETTSVFPVVATGPAASGVCPIYRRPSIATATRGRSVFAVLPRFLHVHLEKIRQAVGRIQDTSE